MRGDLAEEVRSARTQLAMTQVELARRAGVSLWTVQNVENGWREVKASTAAKLRRALDDYGYGYGAQREQVTEWAWDCRNGGKFCPHPMAEEAARKFAAKSGGRAISRTVLPYTVLTEWVTR